MKKLLSIAVLACFIGAIGCSDNTKSSKDTKTTTTNPDGSKTTETKSERKETSPPK